jgi:hypothetical protein
MDYQSVDTSAIGDSIFFNGEDGKSYSFQVLKIDSTWMSPPGYGSVVLPITLNGFNEGWVDVSDFLNGTYPSIVLSVVPEGIDGKFLFDTPPLNGLPPRNLFAESGFPDSIPLRWDSTEVTAMGLLGYNLYRSLTSGGPYNPITSGLTVTNYTDTTTLNDTTYYYVVTADYNFGESIYSNEARGTATIFPMPQDLRSWSGDGVVLLIWDLPRDTTDFVGYNVYRSDTSGGPYSLIADTLADIFYYDYNVVNGDTFYYVVTALYTNPDGESPYSDEVMGTPSSGVGIEIENPLNILPNIYSLSQNFPNPFQRNTKIRFGISSSGDVDLQIFDITGRLVKTLVNGRIHAGYHTAFWDGKNEKGQKLPTGIYFYRLDTRIGKISSCTHTKKLILLH